MQIVVDKDIFFAEKYFASLGDVIKVDGRSITAALVKQADILIVRSITNVTESLLRGSAVRFVGSVTSGTDHIDQACLQKNGIGFGCAAGSNARAVAEYVLSSLMVLMEQREFDLISKTVAIIGCGHTGSLLRGFLHSLGVRCLVNDPPLRDATGGQDYCELNEVFDADIISVHVPLVKTGAYPTWRMIDAAFLQRLREDVILINTSRGDVIDENALLPFLDLYQQASVVLDVWNGEPDIDSELMQKATIATAHIAGHTLDAKLKAVAMVYKQACSYFQQPCAATSMDNFRNLEPVEIALTAEVAELDAIQMAVLTSYDVRTDASALRQILSLEPGQRARFFDDLRSQYRTRREFSALRIKLPAECQRLAGKLNHLGFPTSLQP
ncbi:MAG: Erythronate-4-phosphate dehydrogenase [Gammaproteobacteria bacterium]|nr:Erythronate-4-phosphate dehydrogenase [Gammaproteobacteria bacterium]